MFGSGRRSSHHVFPNCRRIVSMSYPSFCWGQLTFSIPKNLSLPSSRMGPAFRSIFSSGVCCGAFGSFLFGELAAEGLVAPYCQRHVSWTLPASMPERGGERQLRHRWATAIEDVWRLENFSGDMTARTVLLFNFPKNEAMLVGKCWLFVTPRTSGSGGVEVPSHGERWER